MSLKRHAEAFGDTVAKGIELNLDAESLAREVGVDKAQVEDVIARLRRLRIVEPSADGKTLLVSDVARLHEFLEFLEMPLLPASSDLYTPSPCAKSPRMQASPVPA